MASLRKQSKGNSWQLRVTVNGERYTLSLRDTDEAQANQWKRYVQSIADSVELKRPIDRVVNEWLVSLSRDQRSKLSEKGLIEADEPQAEEVEISIDQYLEEYFTARKGDVKGSTWIFYQHTRKRLEEYFSGRSLRSITAIDAKQFRTWLQNSNKRDKPEEGEPAKALAMNTIKRRTGLCRQIFKQAIEDGLIERNPFVGLSTGVRSNKERQLYIELEVFSKVLAKAPNARWRSLLILARLGALRIPSEAQGLKWEHIAWDAKRITIEASSKTEHHEKRQIRIVPLLPAIEKELLKLHLEAEELAEFVFPGLQADTNLRTGLERIIRRAGVKQWPKLWQNLRASGATDFARSLPSHIAAAICGHTEQIAQEHYWTVTDSDLDSAIDLLSPGICEKLAQKLAHNDGLRGPESSLPVSETRGAETKKPQVSLGFDAIFQLLAEAGFAIKVGEEGLEPPTSTL